MNEAKLTNKYFIDRQSDFESSARSYPRKFPFALKKAKGSRENSPVAEAVFFFKKNDFFCVSPLGNRGYLDDTCKRNKDT